MSDTSPRADRKITSVSRVSGSALSARQTSKPSMPGIITSSSIRSGCARRAISSAVGPSFAARMRWPRAVQRADQHLQVRRAVVDDQNRRRRAAHDRPSAVHRADSSRGLERRGQLAHAVEIEARGERADPLAQRGIGLVADGQRVGDRLEIGDRADRRPPRAAARPAPRDAAPSAIAPRGRRSLVRLQTNSHAECVCSAANNASARTGFGR